VRRLWPAIRLSAGLVSLCLSVMFIAGALGLIPDRFGAIMAGRKSLCESLAVQCSLAAQKGDLPTAEAALRTAIERHDDVLSIGLRRPDGNLLLSAGPHEDWVPLDGPQSTETQLQVPIQREDQLWAQLELRFASAEPAFLSRNSLSGFFAFVAVMCFGAFFLFLKPIFGGAAGGGGGAVPQRVKAALNSLAEGVIILDKTERIAMANQAFAELVGMAPEALQGKTVDDLPFMHSESQFEDGSPWSRAVHGEPQIGVLMGLQGDQAIPKRVSINTTPILGEDGSQRGALATFDNLTILERKHAQLRKVLSRLRQSRRVVRRQNHELKALATRDPLTGCYNRRTLFAEFEKHWEACKRFERSMGCVMVDVDHFKSINDRFGHSVGDDVLKAVAETLRKTARKGDLVCRYGGEEFCVLLPHADIAEAGLAAERFRAALAAQPLGGVPVTASLGASALGLGSKSPQEMIDQADKALYAAKRSGRNRIMRFDEAPPELMHNSKELKKPEMPRDAKGDDRPATPVDDPLSIPFQAVSGLLAALTYRHAETAEHCKRVADLCVTAGAGLMSQKDLYVVEMAALLHDIGKLGIPDNVLLKPDTLTPEEWNLLRMHQSIGVEIIRAAFTADELADIVRLRHCWYGGSPTDATMPRGPKIPAGSRLLAIADAFDSIVHDQVYR
jgi:diguanylate cyclase (GGDEF)-like protein/putative nucleotidyltransferase with HDIG domain/PAS domain S-box-containing protein